MKNRRRILVGVICLLTVVFSAVCLSSCDKDCTHKWGEWKTVAEASCTETGEQERTCSLCNETEKKTDVAVGHQWKQATCTEPKTCLNCSLTEGEAMGHSWKDATCEASKTCENCSQTEGEAKGHSWKDATCEAPKTCENCSQTEGEAKGHSWKDATCEAPKTCENCSRTEGEAKGHNYTYTSNGDGTHQKVCAFDSTDSARENCSGGSADCTTKAVCDRCKTAYGPEPDHDWNDGESAKDVGCLVSGQIKYTCKKCSATKMVDVTANGHDYEETVVAAGCTEDGYTLHSCKNCDNSYRDSYTDATGHDWDGVKDCDTGRKCENCGLEEDPLGHGYEFDSETAADCEHAATKTYKCSVCGDKYTDEEGAPNGHSISGVTPTESLKEGSTCEYIKYYECTECGEDVEGEHVFRHNYIASVTKDATCSAEGEKTLTCSKCSGTEKENIEKNDAGHKWIEGTPEGNKREDTCEYCQAKKTVTVYSGTSTGQTNANDLKNTEIQLENANIALDDGVVDKLGDKNVTLSADTLSEQDKVKVGLTPDELLQVGDSPIYNFTINDGTQNIANFDGNWVTITLPYTLSEGEDVDSIAIWFISEDGELESIKATYNATNKTVTFKTNHFSYYTVTKLNPTERCELYGHSYTYSNVAGSCTKDGYELRICVRCHETTKTITAPAQGHDYEANETPATCTVNGKTVYECKNCDHSYTVRQNAKGHKWSETERIAASCEAAGYVKYGCDNCDAEYTDTFPQLKHVLTETVVAPTCESNGYTRHDCDNCDYSYTDRIVEATGHDYTFEWSWSGDMMSAVITFSCANDEDHGFSENATVTKTETDATCTVKSRITYTAVAVINGDNYRDTKVTEGTTIAHRYGTEYKSDTNKHWHECEMCGQKDTAAAHEFGTATVTKNATCAEPGTKVSKCACGYEKTEPIPATGEHNYVSGKCSVCSKEEASCDHTTMIDKSLDLKDYGFCGGIVKYQSCECGEVVTFDGDDLNLFCDIDTTYEEETEDEEAGIYTEHYKGVCPNCGLEAEQIATERIIGCEEIYTVEFSIYKDGVAILDKATAEGSEENHHEVRAEVALTEHTACGSSLVVLRCADCDVIVDLINLTSGCELTFEKTTSTDEKGFVHTLYTDTCATCGLVFTRDIWTEKKSACEYTERARVTLTKGGTVLYETESAESDSNHYTERTEELRGETCDDGILVHYNCKNCDYGYSYVSSGHSSEYINIDLSDYGACGGYVNVYRCTLCDTITSFSGLNAKCELSEEETSRTDEDGTEHYTSTVTCETCGLSLLGDYSIAKISDCVYEQSIDITLKIDGETVFATSTVSREEDHDYEESYTFKGTTCQDGYTVTETCKVCGDTGSWNGSGHRTKYVNINLDQAGACGGYVEMNQCYICEMATYVYYRIYCEGFNSSGNVNVNGNSKPGISYDPVIGGSDGNLSFGTVVGVTEGNLSFDTVVGVSGGNLSFDTVVDNTPGDGVNSEKSFTCEHCKLEFYESTTKTLINSCEYITEGVITVTLDGETLVDAKRYDISADHEYMTIVDVIGHNCDYGYYKTEYCKNCDYSHTYTDVGHDRMTEEHIDTEELGLCGGAIILEKCDDCGTVTDIFDKMQCRLQARGEDENGYMIFGCTVCGATIKSGSSKNDKDGNCNVVSTFEVIITLGGKTVFHEGCESHSTEHDYEHEFNIQGDSCEDGVQVNSVCKDCGKTVSSWFSGHNTYPTEVDMTAYNLCEGTKVTLYECPCGEFRSVDVDFGECNYTYDYTYGENGDECVTATCRTCGLKLVVENYSVKEGCITTHYEEYTVTVGTNVVLEDIVKESYRNEEHDYEYTYEMRGESCTDGVEITATCKTCGKDYTDYVTYHNTIPMIYLDLEGITCGGYFEYSSCPCGENKWVSENLNCYFIEGEYSEYTDENGHHDVYTYTCETCGLVNVEDNYRKKEGCRINYYVERTLTDKDGNVLLDKFAYSNSWSDSHDYVNEYELKGETCKEGVTIRRTCKNCDYSSESEYTWCNSFLVEDIDLEAEGVCGGGYVKVYECPCGTEKRVEYDHLCKSEYEYVDNEDGGYTETEICHNCGLYIEKVHAATERVGCYDISYVKYTISVGDKVLLDGYEDIYSKYERHEYEYEFTFEGESCEDGIYAKMTCKVCGAETNRYYSYHSALLKTEYDLTEYGACEGGIIYIESCPCGEEKYFNRNLACKTYSNYNYETDDDGIYHEYYTITCRTCGLSIVRDYYEIKEGCEVIGYYVYDVTVGDQVVIEDYKYVHTTYESHDYEYSFGFEGESCEDGVLVTGLCRCGETCEDYIYYHNEYLVKKIKLAEYGACGGHVEFWSCPCGESGYTNMEYVCDVEETSESEYDEEADIYRYSYTGACRNCGFNYFIESDYEMVGCERLYYQTVSLYFDDTLITDPFTFCYERREAHDLETVYELLGETCEDGVRESSVCRNCDFEDVNEYYYHSTHLVEEHDLGLYDACYGYVEFYECVCGYEKGYNRSTCAHNYNYESYEENGITYNVELMSCEKCGLRYQTTSHNVRDASVCTMVEYYSVAISVGNKAVTVYDYEIVNYNSHDYETDLILNEGATTCYDGYTAIFTCRDCGHSYTSNGFGHISYEIERIDLSKFGSVCGGYAVEHSCACGYYHNIALDADSFCEFNSVYFREEREGTLGGVKGYDYICAVTDPACGFTVRVMEYIVQREGSCYTDLYNSYLFGYNAETGEYEYEMTFKTGSEGYNHSYVKTEVNTTIDGLTVKGIDSVCSVCGSYNKTHDYYDAQDRHVKWDREISNKLNNGSEKYRYEVNEYTWYTNSDGKENCYTSKEHYEWIDSNGKEGWETYINEYNFDYVVPFGADGYEYVRSYTSHSGDNDSVHKIAYTTYKGYDYTIYEYNCYRVGTDYESWSKYDYTYDFSNGCARTTTYTNNKGETTTKVSDCHVTYLYNVVDPTCTQDGVGAHKCYVCEQGNLDQYTVSPHDHYWHYDYTVGYYCGECGIKNLNGASGAIVMEDLTEEYGNGTEYVVGYWNRDLVDYTCYVSLVPVAEGAEEIILEGISFIELEKIRAISFSKDEVAKIVTELGVSLDDYNVKFSFVPYGADGVHDYGIVFESDAAAE